MEELWASLVVPAEDIAPVFAHQVRPSWGDMSISAPLLIAPFHSTLLAAPSLCPLLPAPRGSHNSNPVLSRTLVTPCTCLDVVPPRGSPTSRLCEFYRTIARADSIAQHVTTAAATAAIALRRAVVVSPARKTLAQRFVHLLRGVYLL